MDCWRHLRGMSNSTSLQGKKYLVTGGSAGIGKATAELLIAHGAKVAITGRDAAKLQAAADGMGAYGLVLDMANYDALEPGVAKVVEALGGLDGVINNAGIGSFGPLESLTAADFEKIFSVNVFGLALLTKATLPHLKKQGGDIVNIASTAGTKGFAQGSVYAASKFALRAMTQCWQAELRPHDIRVFGINPSEVTTAFGSAEREERDEHPRKLRSEEIAHAIVMALEMAPRGFIPELSVWATNPNGPV
jgi:3-oxoacyl-[acyl-carrier protein] reductase